MWTLWQDLSNGTINFELVTLTVTFDLLLKNFNIGHNFFIVRDRAFIFGMWIPYDKTFPTEPFILNMWPWPWPLTYFWKTLTLAITFLSYEIKLSYLACVFPMTRPFKWYHKFWMCDLDRDLWPTFQKLKHCPHELTQCPAGPFLTLSVF